MAGRLTVAAESNGALSELSESKGLPKGSHINQVLVPRQSTMASSSECLGFTSFAALTAPFMLATPTTWLLAKRRITMASALDTPRSDCRSRSFTRESILRRKARSRVSVSVEAMDHNDVGDSSAILRRSKAHFALLRSFATRTLLRSRRGLGPKIVHHSAQREGGPTVHSANPCFTIAHSAS